MKRILFVASICSLFTFCSRKTVPPPPAGVSNVQVSRGDSMTSAANASSGFTSAQKDYAYSAHRDTALSGNWTLDGMLNSDGSWKSTQPAVADSMTVASTDTALVITNNAGETIQSAPKGSKGRKAKKNPLYDSANARLNRDYHAGPSDTTAVPAFEYWRRTPMLTIDASRLVFTGNTGCNSLSGTFSFTNNDIRINKNLITSKMACNGYDESIFTSLLQRADNFTINGNMLELRQGNTLLLSFRRS